MIDLKYRADCQCVEVSGDPQDVALFWVGWQHSLWPQWITEVRENGSRADVSFHLRAVVRDLRQRGSLLLSCNQPFLKDAIPHAIDFVRNLGIELNASLKVPGWLAAEMSRGAADSETKSEGDK